MREKFIHQIWLGKKPIPSRFRQWMDSWSRHFPAWEYKLWTDVELIEFLPRMICRDVFSVQPNVGVRSDILRLELLREFGGIYADCDFECLRPFEHLLQKDCFHYGDEYPGRPGNAWMCSVSQHPVVILLLEQFKRTLIEPIGMDGNWEAVVARTGPEALHRALNYWVGHWVGETLYERAAGVGVLYSQQIVGFWRELIYPYSYCDHGPTEFSRARYTLAATAHHWAGTWK